MADNIFTRLADLSLIVELFSRVVGFLAELSSQRDDKSEFYHYLLPFSSLENDILFMSPSCSVNSLNVYALHLLIFQP